MTQALFGVGIGTLCVMKMLRHAMLGFSVVALCLTGCAERPGKKKDDDKADKKKDDKKKDDKKKGDEKKG